MANNLENISPAKLVDVLGASKDMVSAYDSNLANSNYNTLGFMYESFVEEMLFKTPELIEGLPVDRYNTGLELKIKTGTKLELKPNDQGDFENPLIEGASEIQVTMAYSAAFYKFSTDTDTLLELSDIKDAYINGYVVNRTTNKGYSFRTDGELTLGWGMIAGSFSDTDGFEYQNFRDNVFKLIKQEDGSFTGSGTLVYTCKSQVNGTYLYSFK